ncbi:SDR family oxidoreductase [Candidatus Berkiella aquae]|uniref:Enoyl-[acyl-carrier-protein] reductase [NADH] n=1 Tax=Candidatus Berkiella aquae TaxID=295108 RepID=A0A0Q9YU89_9GAMM|nr:enoyl-ACP reductase [Candidatus Berkiella aquae]MCS5711722.1 enoyl-ACP reductase [Candidatus Berkiella aquae]
MGFLAGKRILIIGLISNKSIAAGIATAMQREGAELAFTYQSERFQDRIKELAAEWHSKLCIPCDVASDEEIAHAFSTLGEHWDHIDAIVHSVAYAPADQLSGQYHDVLTREGFRIAHDISSYSFGAIAKAALPFMKGKGSLLTLSYLGAERAIPSYNVMGLAKASLEANVRYLAASMGPIGIRVNGISAGPIKTLAAAGIKDFKKMLTHNKEVSPLRKNVDALEVGNAAAFLCSDLASGITGEILHVDAGFHIAAMPEFGE